MTSEVKSSKGIEKMKISQNKATISIPSLRWKRTTKSFLGMTTRTSFSATYSMMASIITLISSFRFLETQRRGNSFHQILYLAGLLSFFSACDQSFQPLEANDEFFFSMYGYLDAGADTQWVHVTPIREQLDLLSDGSDIKVTIKNIQTGREIVMNDSLFERAVDFLNFWTDKPIEYDQTYRLSAELESGEKSQVLVTIPPEMPDPIVVVLTMPGAPPDYFVLVDEQVNLADIQVKYYMRLTAPGFETIRTVSFSYRNSAEFLEEFPGYYTVELKPDAELREVERQLLVPPEGDLEVVYRQVFVASSGEPLQEDIETLDDVTYALPQTVRNVDMGLGYVIGIDGKYVPYEGCLDERGNIISCGAEKPFQ